MDSDWRSKLKNTLSELEAALNDVDSEYERELEVLNLKYKSRREALQRAASDVAIALGGNEEPEAISRSVRNEVEVSPPNVQSNPVVHLNDVKAAPDSSSGQADAAMKRFSVRGEIERLLSELDPRKDIKQGEIRYELEKRFPEHGDSLKPASISSSLRRLVDAGKLVLVSKGSGSEPNIYRLPGYVNSGNGQEELGEVRE